MDHLTKLSFVKAALTADTALMGASLMPGFVGAGASLGSAGLAASKGNYWEAAGHAAFAPLAFFGGGLAKGLIRGGLRGLSKSSPTLANAGRAVLRPTVGVNTAVGKTLGNRGVQIGGGLGIMGGAHAAQGMADDAKQFNLTKQQWGGAFSNFMDGRRGAAINPIHAGATGNPNLYT